MPRLVAITVSALGLLVGAPRASAQGGLVEWSAPPGCPGAEAVDGAIASLLGDGADRATVPPMRADVVALADGAFELTLRAEAGTRTVRDESCAAVADAAALIVAMSATPELHSGVSPMQVELHSGHARMQVAEGLGVPGPEGGRGQGVAWGLGVSAVGEVGALPGVSVGPAIGVGIEVGVLRIEGRGLFLPPRHASVDNHASAGGDVWLLAIGARACAVALEGAVTAGPCGGIEAGAMHAAGDGVSAPRSATAAWGAASAGGFLAVPVAEHLFVRADLEAAVVLNRPAFVIDGVDGEVHRPGAVSGRLSLGAEVRFR